MTQNLRLIGVGVIGTFIVLVSTTTVIAKDWPSEFEMLTAKKAEKIERIDAVNEGVKQLSYITSLSYPNSVFDGDHYLKLAEKGWIACKGPGDNWSSHLEHDPVDKTNEKIRCVFGMVRHFVKDTRMLVLLQERRSKPGKPHSCPSAPDNSEVAVDVIIYSYDSPNQLAEEQRGIGLICDKKQRISSQ